MAKKVDPIIKEAEEIRDNLLSDKEVLRICELREKYIMDRDSNMSGARKSGIEEGIKKGKAEGIKEGKIEIAKNMREKGFAIDEIYRLTGVKLDESNK